MKESAAWWNTLGQLVLTTAGIGVALIVVPVIRDRLPIPTDSVAWLLLAWAAIGVCWVLVLRRIRAGNGG